jgi:FtsX-like permease family protein
MNVQQLRGWLARIFGLFNRKRRERDFAEELESHLAMRIEDHLRAGMSSEEARRQALGARPRDALTMVVRQGMTGVLTAVAGGLVASFALARLSSSLLYGVSATDPATFVMIPVLLTGVAILATFIPARKAMKADPIAALRDE